MSEKPVSSKREILPWCRQKSRYPVTRNAAIPCLPNCLFCANSGCSRAQFGQIVLNPFSELFPTTLPDNFRVRVCNPTALRQTLVDFRCRLDSKGAKRDSSGRQLASSSAKLICDSGTSSASDSRFRISKSFVTFRRVKSPRPSVVAASNQPQLPGGDASHLVRGVSRSKSPPPRGIYFTFNASPLKETSFRF